MRIKFNACYSQSLTSYFNFFTTQLRRIGEFVHSLILSSMINFVLDKLAYNKL